MSNMYYFCWEAASFDAGVRDDLHAPGFRRRKGDRVERLESHLPLLQYQLAASPATVSGTPSQDPTSWS